MRRMLLLIVVTALVAIGAGAKAGGDKGPKSSVVKRALLKRDRSLEQAEAAYRKAAAEANKALLGELKKAKDAAFEAKDQHEVNAVAALIEKTERAVEAAGAGKGTAMAGTWRITWSSGETYRYEVNRDATVLTPEGGSTTVKSERAGDTWTYWINSPHGPIVHTLRLSGDYLVAEGWRDPAAFERGEQPLFAGIGLRAE